MRRRELDPPPELRIPSPLAEIRDERAVAAGVRVWLKRDDLIHPELTGNKWRKLQHNLAAVAAGGHDTLLTFGGAYSNHLRAVAYAGRHFGFRTIGVVRGEERLPLNPSLAYAVAAGMRLTYLDRTAYRARASPELIAGLAREWGDFYLLPEGGSNEHAVRGCAELPAEIEAGYDVICCPVGTGGTLAGIAAALRPAQRAIGFSVLKGGEFLAAEVERLQRAAFGAPSGDWRVECRFHLGGFAKRPAELTAFADDFAGRHGVRLERVYVAKMMYGLFALIGEGAFPRGSRIIAVITGPPGPEQEG